ncbi:hypothetical protein DFH28DRAFT_881591 [Melampsora americana]|nr:hypothetical protein DFH28DRAFT_881591 [Melampsora americana]
MFFFEPMDHSIQLKRMKNPKDMTNENRFSWNTKKKKYLDDWDDFGDHARKHYYDHRFESMLTSLRLILDCGLVHPLSLECEIHSLPLECDVIGQALEFLEQEDTYLIQQVWVLGLIQIFQKYHPTIDILATGSNGVQGPTLSRIGLTLSLTQKMDLLSAMTHSAKSNANSLIPTDLKETLKRVELLYKIGIWNRETDQTSRSFIFRKIYDDLLQASSPLDHQRARSLAERCLEGIGTEAEKIVEEEWMEDILLHLYTFCNKTKKLIKDSLSARTGLSKKKVKAWFEELKRKRNRTLKRKQIRQYVSNHRLDPFIENLLLPFTDEVPVKLDHYKYILDSFEAHHTLEYELFDDWIHNSWLFSSDERFVISVLYSESPYIPGATKYLASRIKTGNYFR